jgi:hypothetical protein
MTACSAESSKANAVLGELDPERAELGPTQVRWTDRSKVKTAGQSNASCAGVLPGPKRHRPLYRLNREQRLAR